MQLTLSPILDLTLTLTLTLIQTSSRMLAHALGGGKWGVHLLVSLVLAMLKNRFKKWQAEYSCNVSDKHTQNLPINLPAWLQEKIFYVQMCHEIVLSTFRNNFFLKLSF